MKENEQHEPWFVRETPFFVVSFCFAPIACVILLLNWKRFDRKTKGDRLFIALMFLAIFSVGFLPRNLFTTFLVIGGYALLLALTYSALRRRE